MSSSSPPRRPSTLSADRFRAAQRPLGAPVELRPAASSETERMMGVRSLYATVAGAPAGPAPAGVARAGAVVPPAEHPLSRPSPAARPDAWRPATRPTPGAAVAQPATTARVDRDNVFVTSVVVAFLLLTLAVAGVKVNGTVQADRSRTAITNSLTTAYEQQTAFRILHQRFATWPELEARGMMLPAQQRVIASNASRSHWFMSVRDTVTGIVCSRTGELFDDSPLDRQPSCSTRPR